MKLYFVAKGAFQRLSSDVVIILSIYKNDFIFVKSLVRIRELLFQPLFPIYTDCSRCIAST